MSQFYSNPEREADTYAMPDCEVFQLTAIEAAEMDEDTIYDYMKLKEHRLAGMNSKAREKMLEAIVEDYGLKGGWYYHYCFPGCLPEGTAFGPYASKDEAIHAAREDGADY